MPIDWLLEKSLFLCRHKSYDTSHKQTQKAKPDQNDHTNTVKLGFLHTNRNSETMHVNPMGQYWGLTMPHTCILLFLHGHANPGTKSHVGKSTWRQDLVPHRWAVLCLTDDGVDTQSFTWTSPIK